MKKLTIIAMLASLVACTDYPKVPKAEEPNQNQQANTGQGCDGMPKLTNAQIVRETQYCHSNNMKAVPLHCGDDEQTTIVQCSPKDE